MFSAYFQEIKDFFKNIFRSRTLVLTIVLCILSGILILRLFVLQIVNGNNYLNNFKLTIEKERTVPGARGNIYDRNGKVLAYNELAYSVCIEDNGTYDTNTEKNKELNGTISKLVKIIESHKDSISNDFYIKMNSDGSLDYSVTGTQKLRFLADIFGYPKIDSLKYNKDLGCNESEVSAEKLFEYLSDKKHFNLTEEDYPSKDERLKIMAIRYAVSQNSYQKYLTTTVATQVSPETVAEVMENLNELQGVSITEGSIRKYNYSTYMAPIIGYTGKISSEELEELNKDGANTYVMNDIIGKAGIEQFMEERLRGNKGYEKIYVDNLGKIIQVAEREEASSGQNIYLTIDSDLQEVAYRVVEQKLAGILISKLINQLDYTIPEDTKASDIQIPISDAYFSLIDNNVIDLSHFAAEDAGPFENRVESTFQEHYANVKEWVNDMLVSSDTAYKNLGTEMEAYCDFIISQLFNEGYLSFDRINTSDEMYVNWKNGNVSLKEYLLYTISKGWMDITKFNADIVYSNSDEIYAKLVEHLNNDTVTSLAFRKLVYKNLVKTGRISGNSLCAILYEQGVLNPDDPARAGLERGSTSAFDFMISKIQSLEITPGMLALDPSSASVVITDPNTGQTLACVSYPGYDNNKLANKVDNSYYAKLTQSNSYPLYNHATQERTAPGSTFKMVTATAALTEGIISVSDKIEDKGIFEAISPSPRCWVYPGNHGSINVSEAIRDSCNYFFYQMGYDMSTSGGTYVPEKGTETLKKYAEMFGLGETTGLEVPENAPSIASEYPVTAAIGQSNHNFTTAQLARYVMTVANRGNCYSLSVIQKITDNDGNVIEENKPKLTRQITEVSGTTWNAVQSGMHMDIDTLQAFNNVNVSAAGKTGTAEEATNRGNHALFVCYAPYENPQFACAVRIPHGYSSTNSVEIAAEIIQYYFKEKTKEEVCHGTASSLSGQFVGD
ncbi:MAG: peptidoglycan glycosyltransferase [Lachnospiraceae bacterium]|nr:peptidoglycan glycosyltransferase [Lachnospiraceae bacterium]